MQVNDVLLGFSLASVIWSGLMFARDVTDEHAERHRRIAHARRRSQRAARGPACGDTRHAECAEAPALPDGNHGENLNHSGPVGIVPRFLRLVAG